MNNPYSNRPEAALLPVPVGCAGWNLWRMAHDVCGVSRYEWTQLTDRRNLLNERTWSAVPAADAGREMWRTLEGRTVVVLGRQVLAALNLTSGSTLAWSVSRGVRWCYAPHPSGLNREYNSPGLRTLVGMRLEHLLAEAGYVVRNDTRE